MDEMNRPLEHSEWNNSHVGGTARPSAASGSAARTLEEKGKEVARNLQNSAAEVEHALEQTAEIVREKGNVAVNAVAKVSGQATRYVRSHDAADVVDDLRRVARRYPTQAMAVALVAGFVVGRSFFRR